MKSRDSGRRGGRLARLWRLWRSRLVTVVAAFRVFSHPRDAVRFLLLWRRRRTKGAPLTFRIRALGGLPVWLRPGTTDVETLWNTFFHGYHLPPELVAPEVIVDLGANVGYTCCHFAALFPEARLVALELDEESHALATRNAAPFGDRCTIVQGAAWTEDGPVRYAGDEADAFRVVSGDEAGDGGRRARAWTMCSLFDEFGIDRVDFLKMDVEGAEGPILEAAGPWLDRVRVLAVELHGGLSPRDAAALLEARGFRVQGHPRHWAALVAWREKTPR